MSLARGEACAVTFDVPPSKRGIKDVFGEPLKPAYLIEQLDKAWLAKHPGKEISSIELNRECSDCDSDED